jgi:histone arginine demethylase JMJD6
MKQHHTNSQLASEWRATKEWSVDYLAQVSESTMFETTSPGGTQPIKLSMRQYWQYARTTTEENPLYLFDRWFVQNVRAMLAHPRSSPHVCQNIMCA